MDTGFPGRAGPCYQPCIGEYLFSSPPTRGRGIAWWYGALQAPPETGSSLLRRYRSGPDNCGTCRANIGGAPRSPGSLAREAEVEFERNLAEKLRDAQFTADIGPLLSQGYSWNLETAAEKVSEILIQLLPGGE